MQLKQMGLKMFTSILPDHPAILPVLSGPLVGSKLCCRFRFRPHYLLGHYEKEVLDVISETLKPGQVAYDIGANIGYISLYMAKRVGQAAGGCVYSFEPAPNAFRMLVTNVQLNRQWPVEPYQVALSDTTGIEPFSFFDYDVISRLGDHTQNFADAHKTHVRVETLDNFVRQFELPAPDFIKMDVEGFELHVLNGMQNLLSTHHPSLLIETHTLEEDGQYTVDSADSVIEMLCDLGYTCKFIQHSHPRQVFCTWGHR